MKRFPVTVVVVVSQYEGPERAGSGYPPLAKCGPMADENAGRDQCMWRSTDQSDPNPTPIDPITRSREYLTFYWYWYCSSFNSSDCLPTSGDDANVL